MKCGEEALEVVRHRAPGLLDRLLHHVTRALEVAQARREHLAKRRISRELLDHVLRQPLAPVNRHHLLEQAGRDDPGVAKGDRTLDDQGDRDD